MSFGQPLQTPSGLGLLIGVGAGRAAECEKLLKELALGIILLGKVARSDPRSARIAAMRNCHPDKGGVEEWKLAVDAAYEIVVCGFIDWVAWDVHGPASVLSSLARSGRLCDWVTSVVARGVRSFDAADAAGVLVAYRNGDVRFKEWSQCEAVLDPHRITCVGCYPSSRRPPIDWAAAMGSERLKVAPRLVSQARHVACLTHVQPFSVLLHPVVSHPIPLHVPV